MNRSTAKSSTVEVPTHITGLLDFANGAVGTIITSFDIWDSTLPWLEIHGTKGSLRLPDPNTFGGSVFMKIGRADEWEEVELTHIYDENSRGLGVADMAAAIDRRATASGQRRNGQPCARHHVRHPRRLR